MSSGIFASFFTWFASLFFSKAAEISVVGLQASGKTSFVNVIGSGQWSEDVVPTVAFNFRKVRKGKVTFKIWDVAGQPKFRSMWERYCNGVDAVVFVVDSTDHDKFETARFELHSLLSHPTLAGVPLLVLGNKNDVPGHASVQDLIRELELNKITARPVSCYSCSMKSQHNLDIVLKWLSERGH
ncbi:Arl8a protein [Amylostereum chailletii]|nr:Arl8a protein [Amylostereum chailletii]